MQDEADPPGTPAVPAYEQQPRFPAMPATPAEWRYHPPRTPSWWHRHGRTLRALAVVAVLVLCGLAILALVREQTGTQGLFVGLGLAVLPVPLLLAAFRWLDGVEPTPWRNHAFAFAWGACAATLVALLANSFATAWLADSVLSGRPGRADTLGATVVAPVVEEVAKGAAILLLFVFRRAAFTGVVSGIALAGFTATGFAFTENVLYLGTAYVEDTAFGGPTALHESLTALTFFVRIVLSPFAHPLFTSFTGVGLGIAAVLAHRRRVWRPLLPVAGLLTAVLLHAVWNGAAGTRDSTFLFVYALFMIPVFAVVLWLALWSRAGELRTIRRVLPAYAAAGWFSAPEPWALGSMRARSLARAMARRVHGAAAARTVLEYQHFATSLALLRSRADFGAPAPDFAAREQELLHHLWTRRALAAPPTQSAARALAPPVPLVPWWAAPGHRPWGPPGTGAGPTPYAPPPVPGPRPGGPAPPGHDPFRPPPG